MRRPLLAIAAATIAICIGVARTSNWPIELWPTEASDGSTGRRDGVTTSGTRNVSVQPNSLALSSIAFHPRVIPRSA